MSAKDFIFCTNVALARTEAAATATSLSARTICSNLMFLPFFINADFIRLSSPNLSESAYSQSCFSAMFSMTLA